MNINIGAYNKHYNERREMMSEIVDYAYSSEELFKSTGLTFDADDFIKKVEHTRLTTHMDLRQAFEYEWNNI